MTLELDRAERLARHIQVLGRLEIARESLRRADSVAELTERALEFLCDCCGFGRALALRIDGDHLVVTAAHCPADTHGSDSLRRLALRADLELTPTCLESRAIRMRAACVGPDDRHPSLLAGILGLGDCVIAPIVPETRALLLLIGHRGGPPVDEPDREAVAALAATVASALERIVLVGRLRAQGAEVRRLASSVEAVVREVADAPISLPWEGGRDEAMIPAADAVLRSREARLDALLTKRELEILELMAGGGTNRAIAARLGVSSATVKSHVGRILRKLHAANRAEAVSRYLRFGRPSAE